MVAKASVNMVLGVAGFEPSGQPSPAGRAGNGTSGRVSSHPTVSVVIPVYNEMRTLAELLKRVVAVDFPKEIVIVDDCSTDGSGGGGQQWVVREFPAMIAAFRPEDHQDSSNGGLYGTHPAGLVAAFDLGVDVGDPRGLTADCGMHDLGQHAAC